MTIKDYIPVAIQCPCCNEYFEEFVLSIKDSLFLICPICSREFSNPYFEEENDSE